eukprot:1143957-Pelagomonas_calceolata.AAC.4
MTTGWDHSNEFRGSDAIQEAGPPAGAGAPAGGEVQGHIQAGARSKQRGRANRGLRVPPLHAPLWTSAWIRGKGLRGMISGLQPGIQAEGESVEEGQCIPEGAERLKFHKDLSCFQS